VALAQTLPPATDVASKIGTGWNIGNSLEATGGETAWGNPLITQQLIDGVKAAGFNAVRIPCAWDGHADQNTLTIDPAWLARVKQVVDFAIADGMYVVLDEHWDGGWLEEHPLFSFQTAVNTKQQAYWTQIANFFKSYDAHLLFSGTNEVHADFGPPSTENITVQQSYNQTFVNAVRATGGNNATRTLVVQTYNTNMQHGLNFFTPPTDSAANRLIVETHYYDPFDFTLNLSGPCLFWGAPFPTQSNCTWAYESYVTDLFSQVRAKWVDKGIPVIIGEYGVATRPNLSLDARQYWLQFIKPDRGRQRHQDVLLGQWSLALADQRLCRGQPAERRDHRSGRAERDHARRRDRQSEHPVHGHDQRQWIGQRDAESVEHHVRRWNPGGLHRRSCGRL